MADVFDLVAKIRLDSSEYESGVGKAKGTFSSLASGVGKGLATVAKVGGAAVAAAATGVAALTKMGVEGYAQYEQLAGGAELLWGSAYEFIAEKAQGAYATVQMSQNEYLAQVNGFSTGLKTALGGNEQAAADLAHRIITAEADIVAATGATQESVQNAFNGIMKSNFSMLDNLQLGITPTKEGFQEVIDKVNEWNRANGNATRYQIGNLADCQAALLDYIEMQGLSGYAAAEAAGTIQGSLAMMKGAWQNLVVGMADSNADMDSLMGAFVDSATIAAENLIPRIEQTILGIGQLVEKLAPVIAEALPGLVTDLLPSLVNAAVGLLQSFANALIENGPALIQACLDAIFTLLTDGLGMSDEVASGIVSVISNAISAVFSIIESLWNLIQYVFGEIGKAASGLGITWEDVFNGINTVITVLADVVAFAADAIIAAIEWVKEQAQTEGTLINTVFTSIQDIISGLWDFCVAAFEAIAALFTWVAEQANTEGTFINEAWGRVQSYLSMVWENIKTYISGALDYVKGIIRIFTAVLQGDWSGAWDAIKATVSGAWETIKSIVTSIVEWIGGFMGEMVAKGTELVGSLQEGLANKFAELMTLVGGWVTDNIITPIVNMGTDLYNSGVKIINKFWDGMKNVWNKIVEWWEGLFLSDKEAPSVNGGDGDGYATGLNYVPYDEFPAVLHRGEAVLTAAEARIWRNGGFDGSGGGGGGIVINQYIQTVPQTPVELASATESYFEQARWML